ncbi:MAG: response regulator [Lachnospiraceae bacterium]|nr:response regulator [Lachnospiraceae bacterium]
MSNKKRILVVDDSPILLRSVKNMLDSYYEVDMATSVDQAMVVIGGKRPDLILLDYDMPICNGKVMLQRLRNKPETKDIPVIFLTAVDNSTEVREVLQMHPQGYLLKPPEIEKLLDAVQRQLWQ